MEYCGKMYGQEQGLAVRRLRIDAWVEKSGNKEYTWVSAAGLPLRQPISESITRQLKASSGAAPVVLFFLGCDVELFVVPADAPQAGASDTTAEASVPEENKFQNELVLSARKRAASKKGKKAVDVARADTLELNVGHGDCVVLAGVDLEVSGLP
jgi:hypothetical protein